MMDIDVYPTIHEYRGNISGLCGNLDGNRCNDCVNKGSQLPCQNPPPDHASCYGGYNYHPNYFTESFKLAEEESLLNVEPDLNLLEPYPKSEQVCFCSHAIETEADITSPTPCSYRQYTSCGNQNDMACILQGNSGNVRAKRDVRKNTNFQDHERTKRAAVMTESEATAVCNLALMASPIYTVCTNMGIPSSEIQTCTADLMLTGDSNWTAYAVDRFQSACLDTVTKNSTLQENFPDAVNVIRNNTCPGSCSGKGTCNGGACSCDEGFASDDCSYDLSLPLATLGLANDDLCDLRYGCDLIVIQGQDFPYGRNYTCQFTGQMTFINSTVQTLNVQNVTAQYQNLFELHCDLPDVESPPERLGVEYSVSIALDPFDFGTAWNFVVLDTTCQAFTNETGAISFLLQEGYCFINGECVFEGTHNKDDFCKECDSKESIYTWSESTECSVSDLSTGGEDTSKISMIIAVTCSSLFVIILVGVGVCYWKLNSTRESKNRSESVTFSARTDTVENILFNPYLHADIQNKHPPRETRALFLRGNKTEPYPVTEKI
ncbi:uncharacterized protein LOC132553682 [Ylistrum balloti]|uniref:uncharacterized protein LOC132553682 n=1 Tax=Ylistrum balloti TaxID=509963 RepID=UPI002905DD13|nr:uncharacterized protein LOC132553682 [Ylistrum balloti]